MPATETWQQCVARWEETARKLLLGRKIVQVRYTTDTELDALGWDRACVVLQLDDGTALFPAMDDEGNDGGALFTNVDDCDTLPVIRRY